MGCFVNEGANRHVIGWPARRAGCSQFPPRVKSYIQLCYSLSLRGAGIRAFALNMSPVIRTCRANPGEWVGARFQLRIFRWRPKVDLAFRTPVQTIRNAGSIAARHFWCANCEATFAAVREAFLRRVSRAWSGSMRTSEDSCSRHWSSSFRRRLQSCGGPSVAASPGIAEWQRADRQDPALRPLYRSERPYLRRLPCRESRRYRRRQLAGRIRRPDEPVRSIQ